MVPRSFWVSVAVKLILGYVLWTTAGVAAASADLDHISVEGIAGLTEAVGLGASKGAAETLLTEAVVPQATEGLLQMIFAWRVGHRGKVVGIGSDDEWLQRWLASLQVHIPTTSISKATFNITVSSGVCNNFKVKSVYSEPTLDPGFKIGVRGLDITCQLDWSMQSLYVQGVRSSGTVTAQVNGASAGGPVKIVAGKRALGEPPLPDKIETYECQADVKVSSLAFTGSILAGALEVLSGIIKSAINSQLQTAVCANVDKLVEQNGTVALRTASAAVRKFLRSKTSTPTKPGPLPEPRNDFVDFSVNPGIHLLQRLVNGALGNASSPFSLNMLATELLGPEGQLSAEGMGILPVSKTINLNKLGTITVHLLAVSVEGLNSWSALAFNQSGPRQLGLEAGLGYLVANLSMKLEVTPSGQGPLHGQTLTESFNVTLRMSDFSTDGSAFLALNTSGLSELSSDQLPSPGCLASATHEALMTHAGLHFASLKSSLSPANEDDSLEHDVDALINLVVGALAHQFQPAMEAVGHHFLSVTFRDMVNHRLEHSLASPPSCPPPVNEYTAPYVTVPAQYAAAILALAAFVTSSVLGYGSWRKRSQGRNQRVLALQIPSANGTAETRNCTSNSQPFLTPSDSANSLADPSTCASGAAPSSTASGTVSPALPVTEEASNQDTQSQGASEATGSEACPESGHFVEFGIPQTLPQQQQQMPALREAVLQDWRWDCLAFHPRTSPALRFTLPMLVVANMMLFAASNSSVATSVELSLKADGHEVAHFPPLKGFTLVGSVTDMWKANVIPLALLVGFFSGFWPYAKLMMMLACWFAPTRKLSLRRRQQLLDMLDALGKWSLVDMFVMVLFMVAFEFHLSATGTPSKAVNDLFRELGTTAELRVYVDPLASFHIFLVATLSSLVLGHVMTACHRYAHKICEFGVAEVYCGPSGQRRRLCNVLRPHGSRGMIFAYGPAIALTFSILLILWGVLEDAFQFTFQGLSGFVLGEEGRVRPFSVLSLAMAMPSSNPDSDSLKIRWIQVAFVLFTMVVSLLYPVILIILWCAPLTNRIQRHLFVAVQVFNAWSALDVFVVSIMVSVLEIERFALSIIGHKCDAINALLAKSSLAPKLEPHVVCFDTDAQLRGGFWLTSASVLIALVVGHWAKGKCSEALCTTTDRH